MDQSDFDRLSSIFERSFVNKITSDELKEFNQLIDDWSTSSEFNLLDCFNHGQAQNK
jgi:hypothetical protein